MNIRLLSISLLLPLIPSLLPAQTLNPEKLLQPPTDTWPTYNGDYSGRRYSTLTQINSSNIGLFVARLDDTVSGSESREERRRK